MFPCRPFVAVFCLAAAVAAPPVQATGHGRASPQRSLNAYDRAVVDRVKARAAVRLREPECQKVFTDFRDRNGRTLRENLLAVGRTASEYLSGLPFADGTGIGPCARATVMMVTSPGQPQVFVCPVGPGRINSRLARVELESPSLAEAMVIHELLHTLGLGENPPTTFEITDRVRARCR